MKVLILNTSERTGGAAVAANRLMNALCKQGVEANMLVRDKQSEDERVISVNHSWFQRRLNFLRFVWERLVIFLCNKLNRKDLFRVSIANTGVNLAAHPLVKEADVIHLHWINKGFLSLKGLRQLIATGKPIVWTMHDMWPATAICHHAWGCEAFIKECGRCPFLSSSCMKDLANYTFKQKSFINQSSIQLVTVSSWLKKLAKYSRITSNLSIEVIPNVLDTSRFQPLSKKQIRNILRLPLNKRIILMGAARLDDPLKGFETLCSALSHLNEIDGHADFLLVLFGGIKAGEGFLANLPIPYIWKGLLQDTQAIAQLYAAADVTIIPSHYETFGQTIIEGMACGCPAVTFDNSGQTDIITHRVDGYLAHYQDAKDLAKGIQWVINHPDPEALRQACVEKVRTHYAEEVVAQQYIKLYEQLLKR